jgi:OOP family OmpA-OmpF porin
MNFLKALYFSVSVLSAVVLLNACKAKKVAQTPAPVAEVTTPAPVETKPAPVTETPAPAPAPVVEKPNYKFANIQFEFNSGILKTASYPIMDKAVTEMKKDLSVNFVLNGNASAEGTDAHNMALSVERATAVNLVVKGYGDKKPVASNDNEAGRVRNRRVEIAKL